MELSKIKGCGPKTIEYLNKLNIWDVDSLIRYYPYRYNIYKPSNLLDATDDVLVISGTITNQPKIAYIRRNFNRISFTLETNDMITNVVIFNRAYLSKHLTLGKQITLIGKYDKLKNQFTANDIKLYPLYTTKVEPVYHMVHGLKQSNIIKIIDNALSINPDINEVVPSYISDRYNFIDTMTAIKEIHNPKSTDTLKKARIKLIYEELFEFMFKINIIKYKHQICDDFVKKDVTEGMINECLSKVPFKLTNDQLNAINDVVKDFRGLNRMNRLLLGDVGSGKTIVAFISMLINNMCGYQSAMLAPTEVLARQHYENFISLFSDIKCALLVGSLKKSEKEKIINDLQNGDIDVLIGTHAMLEDNVLFNNLGLVVTDEQHRFGVNQRKSLQNKGMAVDVLYASATPIPRTYALTIYGDMDISYIKEKPAGRLDIITKQYKYNEIKKVVSEIEEELTSGHQAYLIASLIEDENDTELSDLENIKDMVETNLKGKYKIGLLHGKMKQVDKDSVMNDFKEGKINILISTTVIEVGVDVKNATIIGIFNAERFGLATLHQLRGRVGRSSIQSKCLLISDKETERLSVMEESNDGFYLSEKDFEIRGSGDLFGIRQSGDMIFKIADIKRDYKIILQCKKDAEEFILGNIENDFREYPHYHELVKHV